MDGKINKNNLKGESKTWLQNTKHKLVPGFLSFKIKKQLFPESFGKMSLGFTLPKCCVLMKEVPKCLFIPSWVHCLFSTITKLVLHLLFENFWTKLKK